MKISVCKTSFVKVRIILTFFIMLFASGILFTQINNEFDCGNDGGNNSPLPLSNGLNNMTYTYETTCEPLIVGVRFVFITRGDGFGSFDPNSSRMDDWISLANSAWNSIDDPNSCEPSLTYKTDANLRIDLKGIHTIANTDAWNYRKAANEMQNYGYTSFCPSGIDSGNWPALKTEIDQFNSQHPGTINFFFVENGDHLNFLKHHIDNGIPLAQPWPYYGDTDIFSGCSMFPGSYNSDKATYIVEAGLFTEYYLRLHFGHIYYPEYQHVSQSTLASWVFTGIGKHINHELGHSILNQGHSSCGCLNLMQGSNCGWEPTKNHLNLNQLIKLQKVLSTTSNKKYIDCDDMKEGHCDILVEKDVTLDTPMSIYGNLVIKEGNTLTVKSEVFLSDHSRIIVEEQAKLIVDNGKLTSLCNNWKGINVYGGNNDFDVKFTNNSVIENTSAAAVSMFAAEPWPEVTQWGNGILHAENTTFNNTMRIVEFISWSPLPNSSYIRNCVQNGGKWSITNWNCQGIKVSNNVFNNILRHSIVSEHGSFIIENNKFYSEENDILFNNASAGVSTNILTNEFHGAMNGYNARGTTMAVNEITDNIFQTGFAGIINDGENQYDIRENEINSVYGVLSFDNGRRVGEVGNNDFSGNLVGVLTMGLNQGFNFYENCYSTAYVDNYIDGEISPIISNGSADWFSPANNCFTHSGSFNAFAQDIGGNPDPFTYIEPADIIIDCRDAILAHNNVNRVQHGVDTGMPDCGTIVLDPNSPINYCWPDRGDKNELLASIIWLNDKLSQIRNNSTLTSAQKDQLNTIYNRCLIRVRGYLFETYVGEEDYIAARGLFNGDGSEEAIVMVYSSYIFENDLTEARSFVNSIVANSTQMNDFITIQNINLDRIPYGPYYEPTQSEINTVKTIALKEHAYAGFAKALYYSLTGEVISSEVPTVLLGLAEPRNNSIAESQNGVKVYPNPFSEYLNVDFAGYDELQIKVFNLQGETIYSNLLSQSESRISTANWQQGVYLIRIGGGGEIISTEKFILLH